MKDRELSLTLRDSVEHTQSFKSLRALYDFCKKEHAYWLKAAEKISDRGKKKHRHIAVAGAFNNITSHIDGWWDSLDAWDDNQFRNNTNNLNQQVISTLQKTWLWSGHSFTKPFIDCLIHEGEESANAFIDYVGRNSISNTNNLQYFKGALLGYEFVMQDSTINKRRNGEKVSLGHLRSQFAEAKDELFTEVDELRQAHENWTTENQQKAERLYKINKRLGERRIKQHNHQFDEHLRTWSNTIHELENTYEEKLRLDKPAKYWNKSARKYGIQGGLWTLAIVALVVVAIVNFQELFVNWLQGKSIGIELSSIQGIILFGSVAAIYAYALKIFSRLAFSSFHLMRDAEEREQLTHLYLSLTNESKVDESSRDIVLQALFSRSETGLLAQENGPTMPTLSSALKTATRSRN